MISIVTEKAPDKTQHPFMIKMLNKLVIEGNVLILIKDIYKKPISNIIPKVNDRMFSP